MPRLLRRSLTIVFISGSLSIGVILGCDHLIRQAAAESLFDSPEGVFNAPRTALLLGCAPTLATGRPNHYFHHRIDTAVELYATGKLDAILVSGDNGSLHYDEPSAMRAALVSRGVPDARIASDFAGFRTLDSVVRAKEVFGQDQILVISQRFHNERAIFLAKSHGLHAVGCNAQDVLARAGFKTRAREALARVKAVLDVHLLNTAPKFLGPKIELGAARL